MVAVLRRDGAFPGVYVQMNEEAVQRCAAASGVRVLLSGWGGDEGVSFNGRGLHEQLLLGGRWLRLAAECRTGPHPFRALAHVALSLAHPRLPIHLHRRLRGKEPRSRYAGARAIIRQAAARTFTRLPFETPTYTAHRAVHGRKRASGSWGSTLRPGRRL